MRIAPVCWTRVEFPEPLSRRVTRGERRSRAPFESVYVGSPVHSPSSTVERPRDAAVRPRREATADSRVSSLIASLDSTVSRGLSFPSTREWDFERVPTYSRGQKWARDRNTLDRPQCSRDLRHKTTTRLPNFCRRDAAVARYRPGPRPDPPRACVCSRGRGVSRENQRFVEEKGERSLDGSSREARPVSLGRRRLGTVASRAVQRNRHRPARCRARCRRPPRPEPRAPRRPSPRPSHRRSQGRPRPVPFEP